MTLILQGLGVAQAAMTERWPKYWGKQIFSLGSFLEVGQKQKTERKKEERERERERERQKERLNDGNNNGQAMHGARKPPGPK